MTPEERILLEGFRKRFPNLTNEEKRTFEALSRKATIERLPGTTLEDDIRSRVLGVKV